MNYRQGDKFLIEIDEPFMGDAGEKLYRIKGFKSLVFDDNGLKKLERYKEFEQWDVVTVNSFSIEGDCVVINADADNVMVMTGDGETIGVMNELVKKTGRKLDIGALLKEG